MQLLTPQTRRVVGGTFENLLLEITVPWAYVFRTFWQIGIHALSRRKRIYSREYERF